MVMVAAVGMTRSGSGYEYLTGSMPDRPMAKPERAVGHTGAMSDDLTPGTTSPEPLPTLPPAPPTAPPMPPMVPGYGPQPYGARPYGAQPPGYGTPPPYGVPSPLAPKPSSKRWRVWVPILVLGVVGAVVAAVVAVSRSDDPPSVPRLTETRPAYGTVQVTVTISEISDPTLTYVVESDPAGGVMSVSGSDLGAPLDPTASATPFEAIVSNDAFWSYDFESSVWVKGPPDAATYSELNGLVTTVMLSEFLPDALREFTALLTESDDTVSGHAVTVYDLRLNLPAFQREKPSEYQAWAARLGITEAFANTAIELSVDADGVVWRMSSSDVTDAGLRTSTYEQVMKLLPADYQQDYPTTYYDDVSGQMVG